MSRDRRLIGHMILALVLAVGIWQVVAGNTSFGTGLIASTVGVCVMRRMRDRRIAASREKGMEPYDERAYYLQGRAAVGALNTSVVGLAVIVLAGAVLAPRTRVNPWDLLGFVLTGELLLYVVIYRVLERRS